jgi:hypothetical protein
MVKPEEIDDLKMVHVAREIAKQIENDVEIPGQIKVNIIRETRAVNTQNNQMTCKADIGSAFFFGGNCENTDFG